MMNPPWSGLFFFLSFFVSLYYTWLCVGLCLFVCVCVCISPRLHEQGGRRIHLQYPDLIFRYIYILFVFSFLFFHIFDFRLSGLVGGKEWAKGRNFVLCVYIGQEKCIHVYI
jgi:hypothetical protein